MHTGAQLLFSHHNTKCCLFLRFTGPESLLTPLAICFAPILIMAHSVLDYPRCLLSKSKMDLGSANTYMLFLQTQGEKRNKLLLHINTSYVRSP